MKTSIRMFYFHTASILITLFIIEAALEYRHYNLGYNTPIFGVNITRSIVNKSNNQVNTDIDNVVKYRYGPTTEFPFKSIVLNTEKNEVKRIWIASASHAEGGRLPASDIFPNLICDLLDGNDKCEVINGSKVGMTIDGNVDQLAEYANKYRPDYAILYQMYMAITSEEKRLSQTSGGGTSLPSNSIFNYSNIKTLYQSLSLYVHLTDYIGGNIKLAGQLKNSLPTSSSKRFEEQIYKFIEICRRNNITPIIATFAASHDLKNIHEMHLSQRTNFVKYNAYLSPEGWIKTISSYNLLLRGIAEREDVSLIDIEHNVNSRYEYFIDFVHFNKGGHKEVAKIIAQELGSILSQKELTNGL